MNLGLLLDIIFLIIDIAIALWNSYNAGKISAYRKGLGRLFYTLGGFLPMGYVAVIILTFILGYFGYISISSAVFLFSFSFLVFGLEIIIWGVIATYTTLVTAVKYRDWKAGLITAYNAFATIFDAWDYISGFFSNLRNVRKAIDSSDFSIIDVILILITGLAIGFIVTYTAYKEGYKAAKTRYWY
ncbi:hypothetical protein [Acidianus brierleyi]|uniref:Uncharacterized protein n=1 Tax=Acidianus brierleyi TaxID=41673 RepID=A0A2U9IG82_9CREN|nr:hypothetical protein [Acidianus brierleyi]AWR95048.1 hypothetical protein DFR85_11000 [Acidianus brierleyi]